MRKALVMRFLGVLLIALALSSTISYYFMADNMLKNNISSMRTVIRAVDFGIDKNADIEEQVDELASTTTHNNIRITVIDFSGKVLADSQADDVLIMDNHLGREEIKMALVSEYGYSVRYSDTLEKNMLYVASISSDGKSIIRMAEEFTGLEEYFATIFHFFWPALQSHFCFP